MDNKYIFTIRDIIYEISNRYINLLDISGYELKYYIVINPEMETSPGHVNCSHTYSDIMKKDKICIEMYPKCRECRKKGWVYYNNIIDIMKTMYYRINYISNKYTWYVIINKYNKYKQMYVNDPNITKPTYHYNNDWKLMSMDITQHYANHMIYIKYSFNKIYIRCISVKDSGYNTYYELISDRHYIKA